MKKIKELNKILSENPDFEFYSFETEEICSDLKNFLTIALEESYKAGRDSVKKQDNE